MLVNVSESSPISYTSFLASDKSLITDRYFKSIINQHLLLMFLTLH